MAKRYRAQVRVMTDLQSVNAALREIGVNERKLDQVDADAQKEIDAIKARAGQIGQAMRERVHELSMQISAYAEYHREELFKVRKTVELPFGIFGFRKSTKISVKKTTVALLEALGLSEHVRTRKTANKESLAKLDDATLAQVDASRGKKDKFFCEPNREEINKDLLAAGM